MFSGVNQASDTLLSFDDEVKDNFAEALSYLKDARDKLVNPLARARTCLVQAELMLITVADIDEIQNFLDSWRLGKKTVYANLAENLETALQDFENNDKLFLKCLFYLAKCYFFIEDFTRCRKHITRCISMSRELDTLQIFDQAHQLF